MGQKQSKKNNKSNKNKNKNKDKYLDDNSDDSSNSNSDDNSNNTSDYNQDNNQNQNNDKIKTIADQYLYKKYPKYFLHCRKCYQTYLFKIIISDGNNLNFEVIYKCSCFDHFKKVSISEFMKLLEAPWNEKIGKKKLIEADTTCKLHSQKYLSLCTKCFQLNCDICEKSHANHNLFKLKNLFLYYKTDNHPCKDDDAFKTILNADESYNIIINCNTNIDEKELKSSYIIFLENNVPIYRIYRELYGSYFN